MLLGFYFIILFVTTSQGQLLNGIINFLEEFRHETTLEPPDTKRLLPEYDFIVVGAGTAGCVVANRLSENPTWKILLLEAGGPENYLMDVPILANFIQFTDANWRYQTEPSDKFCLGMENQQCNWPRGKVVGGSSVLNYMIYTRGNYRDYDNWAKLGNDGWSFEEVLPYFKKIEDFMVPGSYNLSYHNHDGYLGISYAPFKTKIADAILESGMRAGLEYIDYNGARQVGVSRFQVSMRDGVRESSSRAYLHPIRHRPNFHMKKFSTVSKILIDPVSKQAKGVEFFTGGQKYLVGVGKEVIVSGGTINSPQLLMLSGIGPKKHLSKMGIPVLVNLKVGYNLMDHIALGGLSFVIDKPYSLLIDRVMSEDSVKEYTSHHGGPMSVAGGAECVVFSDTLNSFDSDGYPDIELMFLGASIFSIPGLNKNFNIKDELYNKVFKSLEKSDSFMVVPMLLRPKSKGRIILQDSDYRSKPRIFPNYLAYDEDMDTIIRGVRLILNITQQVPLLQLGTRLYDVPLPACAHFESGSDDYFKCATRQLTFNIFHYSGSCKMGPSTDKMAVVDPRLRVYGVKGLRVIDASIIPEIPAAHTNAPVFMIAEKGSDMIKEDWAKTK